MQTDIDEIFEAFDKNQIFKDKSILQANYQPEEILHRSEQIKQIASILAPVLRGERTSNLFLYGKTGTGKTLSIQYIKEQLIKRVDKNADFTLRIEYLNCKLKKVADTEYRILAELIKKLGGEVPSTGLPTEAVYSKFIEIIDKEKQLIVLILDEIDQTVKKISSDFLYNLTRLNSELSQTQICIVGISNNLTFFDNIDHEGVITKCAAYAAREHGDARRALDLIRIAGELAERDNSNNIKVEHIDQANSKIERDKILDVIKSEPRQFQFVLYSIILLSEGLKDEPLFTGDVYNHYQDLCLKNKCEVLTQRRVSDIIQEFDMLGIINVRVISKGRGGRMREIKLAITKNIIKKAKEIIEESISYC